MKEIKIKVLEEIWSTGEIYILNENDIKKFIKFNSDYKLNNIQEIDFGLQEYFEKFHNKVDCFLEYDEEEFLKLIQELKGVL